MDNPEKDAIHVQPGGLMPGRGGSFCSGSGIGRSCREARADCRRGFTHNWTGHELNVLFSECDLPSPLKQPGFLETS